MLVVILSLANDALFFYLDASSPVGNVRKKHGKDSRKEASVFRAACVFVDDAIGGAHNPLPH
jgi:hypothetical protein